VVWVGASGKAIDLVIFVGETWSDATWSRNVNHERHEGYERKQGEGGADLEGGGLEQKETKVTKGEGQTNGREQR
jgi:hypothetical protein